MTSRELLVRKLVELEQGRSRHTFVRTDALADLEVRVLETQSWCVQQLTINSTVGCLRPLALAPSLLAYDRWRLVDSLVMRRRQALGQTLGAGTLKYSGRFLVYFPDAALGTSSAESASHGFFDAQSAPPWGTWIGYFEEQSEHPDRRNYLLAWVPKALETSAAAGVESNPEECIQWLHQCSVDVRPILDALDSETQGTELPDGKPDGAAH